jgi:hypothetical protein
MLWLGVTAHPTAEWIARQVTEAVGWDDAPQYLIRDRDRVYGEAFTRRIRAMGIRQTDSAASHKTGHTVVWCYCRCLMRVRAHRRSRAARLCAQLVLGGLLLNLGGILIYRWLITSASRLSMVEYLSLLALAAIIFEWGFIAGVLSGRVIGCATFALSASRINAIKYNLEGSEIRSSLERSAEELAILAMNGKQIYVMALHSYLFFGSVKWSTGARQDLAGAKPRMSLIALAERPCRTESL